MPANLNSKLTDVGHTVIGFAAMAAKQANDGRLGLNARFEPRVRDFRKNAVGTVKSVSAARMRVADTVDPIVDRMVERFPESISESVSETVAEVRKVGRQTAGAVEQRVIEAIEFATAIPAKPVRRTATTKSAAAAKTKASTTAKTAKAATKSAARPAAQAASKAATQAAKTTQRIAKKSPAKSAA